MSEKQSDIWFEKRGAGPLPHYRVVRRSRVKGVGVAAVCAAALLLALFPGLLMWLLGIVLVAVIAKGLYDS